MFVADRSPADRKLSSAGQSPSEAAPRPDLPRRPSGATTGRVSSGPHQVISAARHKHRLYIKIYMKN